MESGKVVTVVVSRDVSVTTTCMHYNSTLYPLGACRCHYLLGLRDSMELVQVQKLSPKFPTPHGKGGLLIHLIS